MDVELRGNAEFQSYEGVLAFSLAMNKLGQIAFHVDITPDPVTQKHVFDEQINQSYLPAAIRGLQKVIDEYPLTS